MKTVRKTMSKETELKGLKLRLTFMSGGAYRKLINCEDAVCVDKQGKSYWQGYNDCLEKIIKAIDEELKK